MDLSEPLTRFLRARVSAFLVSVADRARPRSKHWTNSLGPFIAALIIAGLTGGRKEFKRCSRALRERASGGAGISFCSPCQCCRENFSSQNALSSLSSQIIQNLYRMKTIRLTGTIKVFRALGALLAMTLVAGLVWNPASASCAQIRIEITATVSLIDDPDNLLNNAVAPGDTITGMYTYDSSAEDSNPLDQVGDYCYTTAPNGIRLNVNGLTFATNPRDVNFLLELADNYENSDNYVVISYNNLFAVSATGAFVMNTIDWQLDDPTQTALSSPVLPKTPPVLSNWQSIFGLNILSMGDSHFAIRANVTSAVRKRKR